MSFRVPCFCQLLLFSSLVVWVKFVVDFFILVSAFAGCGPCLFKPSNKTVISQGSSCTLMTSYPLQASPGGKSLQFPTLASRGLTFTRSFPLPAIAPLGNVMGGTPAPRPARSLPCADAAPPPVLRKNSIHRQAARGTRKYSWWSPFRTGLETTFRPSPIRCRPRCRVTGVSFVGPGTPGPSAEWGLALL